MLLESSSKRFGSKSDEHSFLWFHRQTQSLAVHFASKWAKLPGLSWYFPRIDNSFFGTNIVIVEVQTQKFLERFNLDELGLTVFWLRGGAEEFIQTSPVVKLGLSQKYWLILDLDGFGLIFDFIIGAFVDLDGLYLLKSRLWAMKFGLQFDVGVIAGLFLLQSKYRLLLRPSPWLELSLLSNIISSLNIGSLNSEISSINLEDNDVDFYALGRFRTTSQLSQNDYDNRTEFNVGLEGKLGLSAGLFNNSSLSLSFSAFLATL